MRKFYLVLLLFFLIPHAIFANIDLELTLTADKTKYSIYQKITYTLTASNSGNETATGVKIKFPIAPGVAYSNSTTTTGNFNLFFQEWTINSLGNNQTATMDLTIFTLNEDAPLLAYVQVIAANQNDSDSTPNNGTCCTANEDDEAALIINPEGYVVQKSDLRLIIGAAPNSVSQGDEISLNIRPYNEGPTKATNVVIKIELPNGLTFAPNQTSNIDINTGLITFAELDVYETSSVNVTLIAGNIEDKLSIFGQIMSADQSDPDSPHGNDTDQSDNEDDEDLTFINSNITDISLEMDIDKNEVEVGDIVTFTLDARLSQSTPSLTTQVVINLGLTNNMEYVSHEISDQYNTLIHQTYLPEEGLWLIDSMKIAPPHDIDFYQLKVRAKVLSIDEPTLIGAEFIAHFPLKDIDSNQGSFPDLFFDPEDFLHDEEDDEAVVTLYPVGSNPASIFGVNFFDGFRQGVSYLTTSKNQGINGLTVYLYDANDLSQPIQTLETFGNGIQFRGRYHFKHLDPNKNYVVQYTNQIGGIVSQSLLVSPVQRSPYLGFFEPNSAITPSIDVGLGENFEIDFAWVSGVICTLDSAEADAICNDQNTPTPNDDTYNIRYTATGKGAFSIEGDLTVTNQEYPNNRQNPAETSDYSFQFFELYPKWFEAELNLPVNGASSKTLTFRNDATLSEIDCEEAIVVPPTSSCSQLIDMELDFTIDKLIATSQERVTMTISLSNTGSTMAESVEVEMFLPETGFVYQGFTNKVLTLSQGSFEEATQIWTVGNVGAGQTVTLEMEAKAPTLSPGVGIPLFAEVTRAHGYDPDSDVNNDTDQTADEDDEGFILFGDTRKVDVELVNFYPVQASYNEGELVEFFFEVKNSEEAEIKLNYVNVIPDLPNSFTFNSIERFEDGANCGQGCSYNLIHKGIGFSNLVPGESATGILRYNVDSFIGTLDIFAQVGIQTQLDLDSAPNNGTCCIPQEDDEAFTQVEIKDDINPAEGVDLELQYEAASPTFNRWTKVDFTITATNAGTEMATNVVVSTPIPEGLAFTSRELSKGSFNLFFQTWTIPDLAAGETATLDLTLFALATSAVTNFAQVKSLDQMDVDSTPDNNTGTIPQEDDEAAVTISPNGSSGGKNALETPIDQSNTLALYQLFPVPALDNLQVVFGTAGHQVNLFLYDVHGKLLRQKSLQVMRGENAIEVDVKNLTAGFYTISIETPEGFVRGKFLKQ